MSTSSSTCIKGAAAGGGPIAGGGPGPRDTPDCPAGRWRLGDLESLPEQIWAAGVGPVGVQTGHLLGRLGGKRHPLNVSEQRRCASTDPGRPVRGTPWRSQAGLAGARLARPEAP
ncbi:hypothetical protein VFPBJ_03826 [Purpureocillium lilacinum]|uniref:Uncharacterized protein n=1 Tax=Purpureocillium lilacinum TaxID=33203 RepID=A0A179H682_PURLI|nr:hypothetical protein VFPBJ_03826 [Purpureocillium lilacinum]